ncbi:unnamed protein product [Chondrus crispus]|uniref:Uncharacterized protein n=1 Tax=Chondrus crispus TaxID=2769 RepID=R7Q601_CHOCR|nr:unnamed protein product [Chondrus crispus]CDF33273.1 unnamed protein product [Chondrus crispus]|eukprot:XP_005713076.1 unnamed protein product [Chondrus crispus]
MEEQIAVVRDGDILELRSRQAHTKSKAENPSKKRKRASASTGSFFKFSAISQSESPVQSLQKVSEPLTNSRVPAGVALESPRKQNSSTPRRNRTTPVISRQMKYDHASVKTRDPTSALGLLSKSKDKNSCTGVSEPSQKSGQDHVPSRNPFCTPTDDPTMSSKADLLDKKQNFATESYFPADDTGMECVLGGNKSSSRAAKARQDTQVACSQIAPTLPKRRVHFDRLYDRCVGQNSNRQELRHHVSLENASSGDTKEGTTGVIECEQPDQYKGGVRSNETILPEQSSILSITRKKRVRTLSVEAKRKRNLRNRKREQRKRQALRERLANCNTVKKDVLIGIESISQQPNIHDRMPFELAAKMKGNRVDRSSSPSKEKEAKTRMTTDNSSNVDEIGSHEKAAQYETGQQHLNAEKAKLLDEIERGESSREQFEQHLSNLPSHDMEGNVKRKQMSKISRTQDDPSPLKSSKSMRHGSVASALRLARSHGMLDGGTKEKSPTGEAGIPSFPELKSDKSCNLQLPTNATPKTAFIVSQASNQHGGKRRKLSKRARMYIGEEQYNESFFIGFENPKNISLPSPDLLDLFRLKDGGTGAVATDLFGDEKRTNCTGPENLESPAPSTTKYAARAVTKASYKHPNEKEISKTDDKGERDRLILHMGIHENILTDQTAAETEKETELICHDDFEEPRSKGELTKELDHAIMKIGKDSEVAKIASRSATLGSPDAGTKVVHVESPDAKIPSRSPMKTKQGPGQGPLRFPFSQRSNGSQGNRGLYRDPSSFPGMKKTPRECGALSVGEANSIYPVASLERNLEVSLSSSLCPVTGPGAERAPSSFQDQGESTTQRCSGSAPVATCDEDYHDSLLGKGFTGTAKQKSLQDPHVITNDSTELEAKRNTRKRCRSHSEHPTEVLNHSKPRQMPHSELSAGYLAESKTSSLVTHEELALCGTCDVVRCESNTEFNNNDGTENRAVRITNGQAVDSYRECLLHALWDSVSVLGEFCAGRFAR